MGLVLNMLANVCIYTSLNFVIKQDDEAFYKKVLFI